ncbi:hypothetical protein ANN_24815 [Periplaneta americana]|uniref:DUF4817 domain-containing protein n=1 Tax=Periplaneta americana TaxID=6978 RepID=A0ABQ8RZM8_PERAM|nr:hypothetical protein ANN_24815 [Periplaneta americana]
MMWYAETKSVISTQRNYRRVYGGAAPDAKSIRLLFNKLLTTGSVLKQSGGARGFVTEEKVEGTKDQVEFLTIAVYNGKLGINIKKSEDISKVTHYIPDEYKLFYEDILNYPTSDTAASGKDE